MRIRDLIRDDIQHPKAKACGDCFEVAGRAMISPEVPEMRLVHAYVTGQGPVQGRRFSHAWNEIGDVVLDYSNGRQVVMRRPQYYALGQVSTDPGEYAVYDDEAAKKKMVQTHHWGPWDLDPAKEHIDEINAAGGPSVDLEPLYHASLRAFEPEIMAQGLRPGGDTRLFAWSEPQYVYLTPDANVARSFVDPGVVEPHARHADAVDRMMSQGGVLFTIDQNQLDANRLQADPHWSADPDQGNESYAYHGTVPPRAIIKREYFEII